MLKRILSVALAVLLLSLTVSASDRATLFVGDGVWRNDSLLPFIEADGKGLLPVSVFEEFGVKVTLSETVGSLLLERGGAFLSFSLSLGSVTDETGGVQEANIYRYGGEIYLEPGLVCEKFSIMFSSVYASDGYLAARLTDGSETIEFSELLKLYTDSASQPLPYLYNPTGKTVPGSFMHPVLIMPAAANVNLLVLQLGTHKATFAISPERLQSYAAVIPTIYAAGHTVAFYIEQNDFANTDKFAEDMKSANDWLFSFIGRTAKIYVSTEPERSTPNIDGYFKKCCNIHLVAEDLANERIVNMTLTEAPEVGAHNFALASDKNSRDLYKGFFKKFDSFAHLRSMPLTESGSTN